MRRTVHFPQLDVLPASICLRLGGTLEPSVRLTEPSRVILPLAFD